jgi:hypothetical protein
MDGARSFEVSRSRLLPDFRELTDAAFGISHVGGQNDRAAMRASAASWDGAGAAVNAEADRGPGEPLSSSYRHAAILIRINWLLQHPARRALSLSVQGESHDHDATRLHWFAGAISPDRYGGGTACGSPGFDRARPLKRN